MNIHTSQYIIYIKKTMKNFYLLLHGSAKACVVCSSVHKTFFYTEIEGRITGLKLFPLSVVSSIAESEVRFT